MRSQKTVALASQPRVEPLHLRLSQVAALVGGTLDGDADPIVSGVAGIHEADAGDLTFLANPRYRAALHRSRASAVLVHPQEPVDRPAVRVADPALAFTLVLQHFAAAARVEAPRGIHPTAVVDEDVHLGRDVSIGAHVVIEAGVEVGDRTTILPGVVVYRNSRIGSDCTLHARVTLREGTVLGNRVVVHAGAVIGSDGFGFVNGSSDLKRVPHIGTVELEDDVEVGANTCIDRATIGCTRIGRGTKIDNLVQIAHNVKVGAGTVVCAQVGVSGSTEIGSRCKVGGQVGLTGHIQVGDDVVIAAQAGVAKPVPAGSRVSGYPARSHTVALRQLAALARLPGVLDTLHELHRRLERLEGRGAAGDRQADDHRP